MLALLALSNNLTEVVKTVAQEFGCTEVTVYADYERLKTWVHALEQDAQLEGILRTRQLLGLSFSKDTPISFLYSREKS
jgi:hypothetical protein